MHGETQTLASIDSWEVCIFNFVALEILGFDKWLCTKNVKAVNMRFYKSDNLKAGGLGSYLCRFGASKLWRTMQSGTRSENTSKTGEG